MQGFVLISPYVWPNLGLLWCDAKPMSNIFCGCGWKERNNPNSWWHKMPRYRRVVHHEFCEHRKFNVCCSFLCYAMFCLFAGLWCLKFVIQWRWTFELALVMEQICYCNWVDSWMKNVDHIAVDSLVLEMGRKQTKTNNGL